MEKQDWNYTAIIFDNLAEMKKKAEETDDFFPELLDCHLNVNDKTIEVIKANFEGKYDEDIVRNSQVRLFPNYEEFAAYEVNEGWYPSILQGADLDFNGAPNIFEFIDYKKFGKALEDCFDTSIYWKINDEGAVVELLDV